MEMCCSAAAADRLFDEGVAELDRQMVATHRMRDRGPSPSPNINKILTK